MATNVTLKRKTASGTDDLHPTTDWSQINSKPGTFAPTAHTHGNINDDGQISASQAIASGDHLVIADNSSNNDLTTSSITFGTGTTTFLRNDGTWGTPAGTADTNNYLTGVSGSGDGTVTFTRQGLSNITWNAAHSHSEYLPLAGGTMTGTLSYTTLNGPSSQTRDKIRVWPSGSYTIGMKSGYTYGGLNNDYAMSFQMNDDNDRGFWWGDSAHTDAQGAMALTTNGLLTVASGARIGYGGSDTTAPVSGVINLKTNGSTPDNTTATYEKGLTIVGGNQRLNIDVSNVTNGGAYIQSRHESTSFPTSEYTLQLNPQGGNVTINGNTAWHAGNDGSGSGLDADKLDGVQGSSFLRSDALDTATGQLYLTNHTNHYNGHHYFDPYDANGNHYPHYSQGSNNNGAQVNMRIQDQNGTYQVFYIDGDSNDMTWRGHKIWNAGNDGPGSGLNADLLDGSHASTFAPKASPALTGTPTAPTAAANTNTTQIATTAYVQTEISDLINGANASFDTLKEIQDAMATDTELSNAINALTIGNGTQTITAGTGLSGGGSFTANQTGNSSVTLNLDFSELQDITLDVSGSTEMIVQVGSTEGRKALSEIDLSAFNNDAGWTSNTGDITNVSTGGGLTGGGSSGSVTVSHADTSSQASVNNSGNTFIQDITLDTYGHITGITSAAASDSTKLPLAGGTMTGDLTLDHDGANTANDSHALKFRARAAGTDFEREIKLEDGGGFAFNSNILLTGDVTTNNAARTIDFTGFDKEGTTDFSDRAYIQHTTNTGGHSGSVLVISSQNDSSDGIAFQTNASSRLKHNSNNIFTDAYHPNADKWTTARTLTLSGDVTGSVSWDGSGNATMTTTVADDSHNHTIANVDGLQTALNGKASSSHNHAASEIVTGELNTARLGSGTATSGYVLKSDGDGTASWQQDNNTTYTLGSFGVTATAAELNKMDGVTATTAELNKMDGVTATTTELNYTDGVTSNIQTQLNGKLSTTGTAAQASAVSYVTSCPTANNTTGMKVYVGSTDCSTKYSGWLYLVT